MNTVFDNNNDGIILETGENLKKGNTYVRRNEFKKSKWSELVVSFILGVAASMIATMLYESIK